ncbi:MAG: YdiU family protein [Oscillospiraceae bacterium]|nr:YdiU family protein [Oscillospiraceae bacterium]
MWNLNSSYTELPSLFFTKQNPVPVREPKQIIFNNSLADCLGIPLDTEVFAGNAIPETSKSFSQAYAGHQFGHFTMLGDGRAVILGEQLTKSGERFDIQLKGAGRTPYSRKGDGRAALAPMLREYIISEAMHALGIPTTRSLSVVTTGEVVAREEVLSGAILTRIASSHIRVGTFEYAKHFGSQDDVQKLADYTIERHFPEIVESENKYMSFLEAVAKRQAKLIAKWQLVGFIHGVMNTDNMAISGETIDYGPCAFMDRYNPATVFSSIDTHGRYSYENQPIIAAWNLSRFAETLLRFLHSDSDEAVKLGNRAIMSFQDLYNDYWLSGMRAKLGLCSNGNVEDDELLINDLLQIMQKEELDYTNTFRSLSLGETLPSNDFHYWNKRWQARLEQKNQSKDEISKIMRANNPAVIPRNHRVEEALTAAENGDLSVMNRLLDVLKNPYGYTAEQKEYSKPPECMSCDYQTFCGT